MNREQLLKGLLDSVPVGMVPGYNDRVLCRGSGFVTRATQTAMAAALSQATEGGTQ